LLFHFISPVYLTFSFFVVEKGNLAFTVTKEDLKHHFKGIEGKGKVVAVRLLTERGTNKPRGCAFVEFENAEALHVHFLLMWSERALTRKKFTGRVEVASHRIEWTKNQCGNLCRRWRQFRKQKEKDSAKE
jgi:hypothetical protein